MVTTTWHGVPSDKVIGRPQWVLNEPNDGPSISIRHPGIMTGASSFGISNGDFLVTI